MRNSDHFQDQDEPHHDHDESRTLREEHQPAPSLSSTADVRPPVSATSRRLSRAEERHLREWAGTLVRPIDGNTHVYRSACSADAPARSVYQARLWTSDLHLKLPQQLLQRSLQAQRQRTVRLHIGLQACDEQTQTVVLLGICHPPSLLAPLALVHLAWINERNTPLLNPPHLHASMLAVPSRKRLSTETWPRCFRGRDGR